MYLTTQQKIDALIGLRSALELRLQEILNINPKATETIEWLGLRVRLEAFDFLQVALQTCLDGGCVTLQPKQGPPVSIAPQDSTHFCPHGYPVDSICPGCQPMESELPPGESWNLN